MTDRSEHGTLVDIAGLEPVTVMNRRVVAIDDDAPAADNQVRPASVLCLNQRGIERLFGPHVRADRGVGVGK